MKLSFKRKDKKLTKHIASQCFNCGHPFFGGEKFCPECGQENKDPKLTFGSFLHQIFNGFISWDSRFWTTIIPLLIKPGKVSKEYIEGKRQRYANPFRFYLTISVLFFLLIGTTRTYEKLNKLRKGATTTTSVLVTTQNDSISKTNNLKKSDDTPKKIDSITTQPTETSTIQLKENDEGQFLNGNEINLDGLPMWNSFYNFHRKHPDVDMESALDSLEVPHSFYNRFIFNRVLVIEKLNSDGDKFSKIGQEFMSYLSISMFILLPLFTLSLSFFYMRRRHTYVEHLVFVFHTQTVFFLLLTLFYLVSFFRDQDFMMGIFFGIFLLYLFLALKKFYQQGFFKTLFKFILINFSFFIVSILGIVSIAIITFAMY